MKRLVSMALLVAAMLGASLSASAKGRRAEVVMKKRGDFRKEIMIKCNCPRAVQMRHMDARFDGRRDVRFLECRREVRFDPRFEGRRFDKRFDPRFDGRRFYKRHHGKKHHRR